MRVSTTLLQLGDAFFGGAHALVAFEGERLGDDADGQDALFTRRAGDDRGCAGAGAAAHAGGDEAHVRAFEAGFELIECFFGGRTPDLGAGAGAEALRDLHAELDAGFGLRCRQRLRIGIGDDEINPLQIGS